MINKSIYLALSFSFILGFPTHAFGFDPEGYQTWKQTVQHEFKSLDKDYVSRISELLGIFRANEREEDSEKTTRFYAYALIREYLSLSPVKSIEVIDYKWLGRVETICNVYRQIEKASNQKYLPAGISEAALIEEAQATAGLPFEIVAIKDLRIGGGYASIAVGTPYIALPEAHNFDELLFVTYHELGHIMNRDVFEEDRLLRNKSPAKWLDEPEVRTDLEQLKRLEKLGATGLDSSTTLGRRALELINERASIQEDPYWKRESENAQYCRLRAQEARADLFSMRQLQKQNETSALLFFMRRMLLSENPLAHSSKGHPPGLERALYIAGLLLEAGYDINRLISNWEHGGVCMRERTAVVRRRIENSLGADSSTDVMLTFLQAYEKWIINNPLEGYKNWRLATWPQLKDATRLFRIRSLKSQQLAMEANPGAGIYQKRFLYEYNLLREFEGEDSNPLVDSLENIDKEWLEKIFFWEAKETRDCISKAAGIDATFWC